MKKILMCLTVVLSFIGVNKVSADTIEFNYYNDYFSYYSSQGFNFGSLDYVYDTYSSLNSEVIDKLYQLLIEEYNVNYSSTYPYYFISLSIWTGSGSNYIPSSSSVPSVYMSLFPLKSTVTYSSFNSVVDDLNLLVKYESGTYILPVENNSNILSITYNKDIFNIIDGQFGNVYNPLVYYSSNFNLVFDLEDTYVVNDYNDSSLSFNNGDIISTYESSVIVDNYVEINLNDYAYVALSLKDYNQDAFSTNVQVKGQYCLTPVYNYGMTERKDILTGTQVERCSPYYQDYTPVRTYILDDDLKNNAIYYLKSYDTSKDNYVKVDTYVFDVTLITEEDASNPYVTVNGKSYPTIPYDELTDTATKSEDEDYVSGSSEEFTFSDIFLAPLDYLKEIWGSVGLFFTMIEQFILLLPKPMQGFLFTGFTLAIVLGLIKIIL